MNKFSLFTISTLALISQLLPLSLSSPDPYYGICQPAKCGGVNITYPFHIPGQQKTYCGYPGFEVSCINGTNPSLNISGGTYVINDIWYKNQTVQLTNSFFLNPAERFCPSFLRNLTLQGDVFKLSSSNNYATLLLNCSGGIFPRYGNNNSICGAVALDSKDSQVGNLLTKCDEVVSVPYESDRRSNFTDVLRRGFLLNWVANNCSDCEDSGGQCGFNGTTSRFACYCQDRIHSRRCDLISRKSHNANRGLILGLVVAGVGVLAIILIALIALWHHKKRKFSHSKFLSRSVSLERTTSDVEKGSIYFGVPLFSYRELQEATNNFHESRELGDGGFGTVYYGKLKDGREVAVKRLYEKNYRRVEQFMNEVQILTCLRHQNLVSLYGCTSQQSRELLLVYEYVPNGTVADHLYGDKAKDGSLPWSARMRVAVETASALTYLHNSEIIHRDVKTNNILLDSSFSVKVADFGLSRLFPSDVTHVSTAPQGTPGYLDPEYHQCYQLTGKSDVYSFGVVLIELISSLPAVDMDRHRHEINLSNFAMNRIQRCAFGELVDPKLGFGSDFKVTRMTTSVAELAFQCLQHDKEFRPSMDEVLEALRRIEGADYDALKAEEETRKEGAVGSCNKPPLSPSENEDVKLLPSHHHQKPLPASPDSVMDKWGSRTTTPSSSK